MKKLLILFASCTSLLWGSVANAAAPTNWRAHPTFKIQSQAAANPQGYTPSQIRHAYGFDAVSATGQGRTMAIVDAYSAPTIAHDLQIFSQQFGLPTPNTGNCTVSQGPHPCLQIVQPSSINHDSGWATEIALDVEWSHAAAPKADILLVLASDSNFPSLMDAVKTAVSYHPTVLSLSWGGPEFAQETTYTGAFTAPTVASAGDNGSEVLFPAALGNVLSVGGTHLSITGHTETAWSGSGGGVSRYVSRPPYQSFTGWLAGTKRLVPDVAYNADPATGYAVYSSATRPGWLEVGGTSAGAPQWAGILALTNTNQDIATRLYTHQHSLNDILSGRNGSCGNRCLATKGYDTVTGLGSPIVNQLVP
jgi:subtilase family serine protease